ncbi:MAG: class I SAM-dependent methyltransferase [Saprospiraceae bacterium]|nr:class I SAM-dependent methyltransferase [Saprospiraceae bacterium]
MNVFKDYPKKRIKLPEAYMKIYDEYYKVNREGESSVTSFASKIESWLHKKVASDVSKIHDKKTLEIGAGTLNQLNYEKSNCYDIIEPYKELYLKSKHLTEIKNIFNDIDEVDLNSKYERITSVATFEHILDLPKVVAKTCILLSKGGSLRTSIPNEGRFLWKLAWKISTGIEFKHKYRLDYATLMQYEHVNTADEIEEVLKYFYENNKRSCYGVGKDFSLYRFYESSNPRIKMAEEYLKTLDNKQ